MLSKSIISKLTSEKDPRKRLRIYASFPTEIQLILLDELAKVL